MSLYLWLELDGLAPELGLGVDRPVEDEVGRRVAGLGCVGAAAVRVKGRDGRVVADLHVRSCHIIDQSQIPKGGHSSDTQVQGDRSEW